MNKGLEFLSIDITHRCNLHCGFCAKLVQFSDWQATMCDIELFCKHMQNSSAECLRLSGGEATVHPQFDDMVRELKAAFPNKKLELGTNGILLHRHESIIPLFWKIIITPYAGRNDEAIARYESYGNVHVRREQVDWFDPNADPQLSAHHGNTAYDACMVCMVNVVGNRVYGCCQAEVAERTYHTPKVHTLINAHWMDNYLSTDMIPACQHCAWAAHNASIQQAIHASRTS